MVIGSLSRARSMARMALGAAVSRAVAAPSSRRAGVRLGGAGVGSGVGGTGFADGSAWFPGGSAWLLGCRETGGGGGGGGVGVGGASLLRIWRDQAVSTPSKGPSFSTHRAQVPPAFSPITSHRGESGWYAPANGAAPARMGVEASSSNVVQAKSDPSPLNRDSITLYPSGETRWRYRSPVKGWVRASWMLT